MREMLKACVSKVLGRVLCLGLPHTLFVRIFKPGVTVYAVRLPHSVVCENHGYLATRCARTGMVFAEYARSASYPVERDLALSYCLPAKIRSKVVGRPLTPKGTYNHNRYP